MNDDMRHPNGRGHKYAADLLVYTVQHVLLGFIMCAADGAAGPGAGGSGGGQVGGAVGPCAVPSVALGHYPKGIPPPMFPHNEVRGGDGCFVGVVSCVSGVRVASFVCE